MFQRRTVNCEEELSNKKKNKKNINHLTDLRIIHQEQMWKIEIPF